MSAQTIQTIGEALLHFLWQGAALALLLPVAISFTRSVRVRYAMGVCILLLMALCPLATLAFLKQPPAAMQIASALSSMPSAAIAKMAATPVANSFNWLSCLVWVWCAGVCLLSLRAFGGWLVLQRLKRTAQEAIPAALLERCRRLQARIGIQALVGYAYSDIVEVPAVVGWFRPVVLIPLSAVAGLSIEQLEAIIAHELAHVRRYDALVNLFQIAAETVLFYHPAVWWVNRMIRAERENCCDDIAVAMCGNASEYARALAMMSSAAGAPAWAMAANGGALKARVGRLLGMQKMTHGIPRAGFAVLAVTCASCVVLTAGAFKQDVPNAPPPPPPPAATVEPPAPLAPPEPDQLVEMEKLRRLSQKVATDYQLKNGPLTEAEDRKVEEAVRNRELHALVQTIDRMRERYTADYPDLQVAEARLAQLTEERRQPKQEEQRSGGSYIDSLESVGLKNLSVDDLIGLKVQGVTADYVRQLRAAGFNPSIQEIMGLKVQGVTPEYIRELNAAGIKPNLNELLEMKVQGVTPEFIRDMQSAGFGELKMQELLEAKIQGVTPEFIAEVRSHGFKDLTFRQLISLKIAGVF